MKFLPYVAVAILVAVAGVAIWLWTPDKSRATLEAKYLTAPGDLIDVAGIRLHVRDTGPKNAPAVILLHGFGSSLHTWESWAEMLSGKYRVVRLDLPGTGLSGADPAGDYSDNRSLQVLAALMDRLQISKASVIGNSMGGRIAWNFAVRYPERIEKLVLIAPDGFASPGRGYGERPNVPAMAKLVRYVLPKTFLRKSLAPAYADPSRLNEETVTRYHDLMLAPGARDAMIARMEQTELVDPHPLLSQIKAPTLLLWGERDAMIPVSNAQDYAKILPDSTTVILPGLGHVPHEEAPAISLEPVASFLAHGRAL